jgi:hypothetical protein
MNSDEEDTRGGAAGAAAETSLPLATVAKLVSGTSPAHLSILPLIMLREQRYYQRGSAVQRTPRICSQSAVKVRESISTRRDHLLTLSGRRVRAGYRIRGP